MAEVRPDPYSQAKKAKRDYERAKAGFRQEKYRLLQEVATVAMDMKRDQTAWRSFCKDAF